MEKIRRKKIEPEIRKMWKEVMIPLEKVIEKRDEVFRRFALDNNYDYCGHASRLDSWGRNGLTSLRLNRLAIGEGVAYLYFQNPFRPTNLDSEFYKEVKKDRWFHDDFNELSKSGLFEVFYSELARTKPTKDKIWRLKSILRESLGYSVGCNLHLKKDSGDSWKIPIKEIVRIGHDIDQASFFGDDYLEITKSGPTTSYWEELFSRDWDYGERKPRIIDEFLRRDPDEDSESFQDNLRTLKQASDDYYRLVSDEEVQEIFREYEKNPMGTLKRVRNLVKKEFPDNTKIASYFIKDVTERTSRKIRESAQRIF